MTVIYGSLSPCSAVLQHALEYFSAGHQEICMFARERRPLSFAFQQTYRSRKAMQQCFLSMKLPLRKQIMKQKSVKKVIALLRFSKNIVIDTLLHLH